MAVKMIEDVSAPAISNRGTIIEGTSGNTGMAVIAAVVKGCAHLHDDRQTIQREDRRARPSALK